MKIPKTKDFEDKVKAEFNYLVTTFGFSEPDVLNNEQEYRDRLVYTKDKIAIEVLNAWHPSDYGFEVNFYPDRKLLDIKGDHIITHEMVYYKVKEKQSNLSFIEEGAKELERVLKAKLKG